MLYHRGITVCRRAIKNQFVSPLFHLSGYSTIAGSKGYSLDQQIDELNQVLYMCLMLHTSTSTYKYMYTYKYVQIQAHIHLHLHIYIYTCPDVSEKVSFIVVLLLTFAMDSDNSFSWVRWSCRIQTCDIDRKTHPII